MNNNNNKNHSLLLLKLLAALATPPPPAVAASRPTPARLECSGESVFCFRRLNEIAAFYPESPIAYKVYHVDYVMADIGFESQNWTAHHSAITLEFPDWSRFTIDFRPANTTTVLRFIRPVGIQGLDYEGSGSGSGSKSGSGSGSGSSSGSDS